MGNRTDSDKSRLGRAVPDKSLTGRVQKKKRNWRLSVESYFEKFCHAGKEKNGLRPGGASGA